MVRKFFDKKYYDYNEKDIWGTMLYLEGQSLTYPLLKFIGNSVRLKNSNWNWNGGHKKRLFIALGKKDKILNNPQILFVWFCGS